LLIPIHNYRLSSQTKFCRTTEYARVVELVDTLDLKSSGL
jgi:hypothetical protein